MMGRVQCELGALTLESDGTWTVPEGHQDLKQILDAGFVPEDLSPSLGFPGGREVNAAAEWLGGTAELPEQEDDPDAIY